MTHIEFKLNDEHSAMLEAIVGQSGVSKSAMARDLLISLLEDDAAQHGAFGCPDDKVIFLRNWKGAR